MDLLISDFESGSSYLVLGTPKSSCTIRHKKGNAHPQPIVSEKQGVLYKTNRVYFKIWLLMIRICLELVTWLLEFGVVRCDVGFGSGGWIRTNASVTMAVIFISDSRSCKEQK